ncbi:hypothetical protein POF50_031875 [Streptomyces sp. SL13]|uniref:DUF1700 domain-containing protein n=1 Tax=Streptantibioticus silvisoli TaxID=2705255 RepID=A0AA90KBM8_9ACTN|nr:hypothetical protein [Streptantibioticus silvisoli]MDI5973888.1 hypothetical protein [Streptantibioticus silvisoli]
MKTADTATAARVQDYLKAVERETSALPAPYRQELVADLAEHIEVALAERPDDVDGILRELGDPRAIAATALAEDGTAVAPAGVAAPPRRRGVKPLTPVILLLICWVFGAVAGLFVPSAPSQSHLAFMALLVRIAAVITLCRCAAWTRAQKWTGVLVTAILPAVVSVLWINAGSGHGRTWLWVLANIALTLLPLGGTVWLWRNRAAEQ